MILDTIIEKKQQTLEAHFQEALPTVDSIAQRIKACEDLFVIGEIKQASPSKGIIVTDFDVASLASAYDASGVQAISVLTEENFFHGHIEDVRIARQFTSLPILRKDFIMDMREIVEAKQAGADMVLLIVAMLQDEQLCQFYQCARLLGLECIVEVHNEIELARALQIKPEIIGINNRDLTTFEVNLDTTRQLANLIPNTISILSESGITNAEDIRKINSYGVDGVLIGESFMRSNDKKRHLQELLYGCC